MNATHDHPEILPVVNPETNAEVFPHTAPDGRALDATGLVEGCEGCAYLATYYGDSDSEDWREVAVRLLAVGDVVETPHNGASERVVKHEIKANGWVAWQVTGNQESRVPGGTLVWKLFPKS